MSNSNYYVNSPYYEDDVPHATHVSFVFLPPIGLVGQMDPFESVAYVASPRIPTQHAMLNNTTMRRSVNPLSMQNMGLEKLRREVYNPVIQYHRRLYYRDYDSLAISREDDTKKTCVVCLDDFVPSEIVTLTPCNHMFHDKCIVPWVKSHGKCPICRFMISEGRQITNNSMLGSDPFSRDLDSFTRDMEARG